MATGNLGFGAGLAATQVGLCVGISATNIVLDCIIAAKNAGKAGTLAIYSYEQAIERVIFNAIGGASEFVQHPTQKMTEHANTTIDFLNAATDKIFRLEPAVERPDSSLVERVKTLAMRIGGAIKECASTFIFDPDWTYNKISNGTTATVALCRAVTDQAIRVGTTPGAVLLDIIRQSSTRLEELLGNLNEKGSQLLTSGLQYRVQEVIAWCQRICDAFAKARSIEQVKIKVFDEMKVCVSDMMTYIMRASLGGGSPGRRGNSVAD
uniref:Vinculin n=1 Tax=Meloidogyne javanica TaxID=6303 RepID=A0A915LY75_MELJA